jgi:SAM-dependent methyltransferase
LRRQTLNPVTRSWYGVLLNRLRRIGFDESWSMLDYGCGNGLFLDFLRERGFCKCQGYDPYVGKFENPSILNDTFDLVFTQDVIEHDEDPSAFMQTISQLTRAGGFVSIGTPNADGIDLGQAEDDIHHLHMPYHRHIFSHRALIEMASHFNLSPVASYDRFFRDHWLPGANRRFIFELIRCQGNDIDVTFDPVSLQLFLRNPRLLVDLFFGYFLSSQKRDNMQVIFCRN